MFLQVLTRVPIVQAHDVDTMGMEGKRESVRHDRERVAAINLLLANDIYLSLYLLGCLPDLLQFQGSRLNTLSHSESHHQTWPHSVR